MLPDHTRGFQPVEPNAALSIEDFATLDRSLVLRAARESGSLNTMRDASVGRRHRTKLLLDLMLALILLIAVLPFMMVLSLLIALDGGPVLFGHERVGLQGRKFRCLKFRSMVSNPEQLLHNYLLHNPSAAAEWAATQKLVNDPRVTKLGKVLRATSLDELPQLFNILRLDMSLVGPRPVVNNELSRYGDRAKYYLALRPGLTGLWQISGRSNTSYERRVELDTLYYAERSIWMDLKIIAKTVPAVLLQRGAR